MTRHWTLKNGSLGGQRVIRTTDGGIDGDVSVALIDSWVTDEHAALMVAAPEMRDALVFLMSTPTSGTKAMMRTFVTEAKARARAALKSATVEG